MRFLDRLKNLLLPHSKISVVYVFEDKAVGISNGKRFLLDKQLTKELIKNKKDEKNRSGATFKIDELRFEDRVTYRKLSNVEWHSFFMQPYIIFY